MKKEGKDIKKARLKLIGAVLAVLLISVIAGIILMHPAVSEIENEKKKLTEEFISGTYVPAWPNEKESTIEWYYYSLLKPMAMRLEGKELPEKENRIFYNGINKSFEKECTEQTEPCPLYKTLMPYGMANSVYSDIMETKNPFENAAFSNSLNYWREYFESNEWTESNLEDIWGLIVVERLYGTFSEQKAISTVNKIIEMPVKESSAGEKVKTTWLKAAIIKRSLNIESMNEYSAVKGLPSKEEVEKAICEIPSIEDIAKNGNICELMDYFKLKVFCGRKNKELDSKEQEAILPYLKERFSDIKELLCQVFILQMVN